MVLEHKIDSKATPVEKVTVFSDRAEVSRTIKIKAADVDEAGTHLVVLQGVSSNIINGSARVTGVGPMTIEEVATPRHTVERSTENGTEIAELFKEIERLLREINKKEIHKKALKRKREIIGKYTIAMLEGVTKDGKTYGPAPSVVQGGAKAADEMVDYQFTKDTEIEIQLYETTMEEEKLVAELAVAKSRLDKLLPGAPQAREFDKLNNWIQDQQAKSSIPGPGGPRRIVERFDVEVTISIEAEALQSHKSASQEFVLNVVYLVTNAKWSPSYDWRITTDDSKVDLCYFGSVSQCTQEDWNDVEIVLSTAQPSMSSTPPTLATCRVGIYEPQPPPQPPGAVTRRAAPGGGFTGASLNEPPVTRSMYMEVPIETSAQRLTEASTSSAAGHSTFAILRACTIKSDNKPHKVTIDQLQLTSDLTYFAVPSKSSQVFIQAMTVNASKLNLLSSSSVNVYLDNSYLSKTSIGAVAPGEKFSSFLGVDPTVRIESHKESRVSKDAAMLSVSRNKTMTINADTVVYNTKQSKTVKVAIAQLFPEAVDEKVKIKCLEPAQDSWTAAEAPKDYLVVVAAGLAEGKDAILRNKTTSNLVWCRHVAPGKRVPIKFTYQVEYPNELNLVWE